MIRVWLLIVEQGVRGELTVRVADQTSNGYLFDAVFHTSGRIDFGNASILFTGDLEDKGRGSDDAGIETLLAAYAGTAPLDVDLAGRPSPLAKRQHARTDECCFPEDRRHLGQQA